MCRVFVEQMALFYNVYCICMYFDIYSKDRESFYFAMDTLLLLLYRISVCADIIAKLSGALMVSSVWVV